jgi:hypothetical protein
VVEFVIDCPLISEADAPIAQEGDLDAQRERTRGVEIQHHKRRGLTVHGRQSSLGIDPVPTGKRKSRQPRNEGTRKLTKRIDLFLARAMPKATRDSQARDLDFSWGRIQRWSSREFLNIAIHAFFFSFVNSSPTTLFMDVISLESCFEPPHGLVSKSGASQQPFVAEGSYPN